MLLILQDQQVKFLNKKLLSIKQTPETAKRRTNNAERITITGYFILTTEK
jgi:hypothetical protein